MRRKFTPRTRKEDLHRTNEKIKVPKVRLVGENIEGDNPESDIFLTHKALEMAQEQGLDLVEISPNAVPPVCKILDYKKFLYEKKKKEKEIKANAQKTVIKELRFGPNTDDHDFEFKANHGESFLKDGAKVKAYVHFKGRAIVFKDRGELLLLKLAKRLEEFGSPEQLPKLEGKRMIMVLSPKKKNK